MSLRRPSAYVFWMSVALSAGLAHAQDATAPAPAAAVPATVDPSAPAPSAEPGVDLAPAPSALPADAVDQEMPMEVPAGAEATELSESELAEMGLGTGESESAVDLSVQLSGFMDFSFQTQIGPKDSPARGIFGRKSTFSVGNVNLYLSKNLTESVRTFLEVRFTYLPNGAPLRGSRTGELTSTTEADYTRGAPLRWGGVEIERVYLEWAVHEALVVRAGSYLTPYGIWNVDHGSPTIIGVSVPFVVGRALFPERQTGVELFGRFRIGAQQALGYHLTLSNGIGPVTEYRDLDENKAVGARLYWHYDGAGDLRFGGSAFYGSDTSARETISVGPMGATFNQTIDSQSDVLSLALDAQWKFKNLLLQGEFISQQRRFEDGGRLGSINIAAGNRYLSPMDAFSWGTYCLAGYRFDWGGIMPYFNYTYNDMFSPTDLRGFQNHAFIAGFNIRPIDAAVLKIEYTALKFAGDYKLVPGAVHLSQVQLAWAF
jgi:hypothetical protein